MTRADAERMDFKEILRQSVQPRGLLAKLTAVEAMAQDEPTNEQLAERMLEWAQKFTSEGRKALMEDLRMHVPADPANDFDLVMVVAARRLLEKGEGSG